MNLLKTSFNLDRYGDSLSISMDGIAAIRNTIWCSRGANL
jgi:hypothetical protein